MQKRNMKARQIGRLINIIAALGLMTELAFGQTGRASAASIIYVRAGATGSNNGTSWANAYKSLQSALSVAGSGQQIWVAKGTYKPTGGTNPAFSFVLKDGVAIYGGFAGTETSLSQRKWKNNPSILSGDIGAAGDASDNSYHVVRALNMTRTAILDGFTITKGNASAGWPDYWGAGIYNASDNDTGRPTLRNLIIKNNNAGYGGAGMFDDHGAPRLTNVTFSANSAGQVGGGMYAYVSGPSLTNVTFNGNSVMSEAFDDRGGGLAIQSGSATLTNVTFNGNFADGAAANHHDGGALHIDGGWVTLTNGTFSNNKAKGPNGAGGAIFNNGTSTTILTNATFALNSAESRGGAISNENGAFFRWSNVTAGGNSTGGSGSTIFNDGINSNYVVENGILWSSGAVASLSGASSISDSVLSGGCPAFTICTNLVSTDPKLGSLRNNGGRTKTMWLGPGSSAIGAGGFNSPCYSKDQRGVARPQGTGACDMGAYEVKAKKFVSVAAYDGQVLESGKATNIGGSVDAGSATLRVGDNAQDRRYRGLLSFDTSAVPDGSTVAFAQLVVTRQAAVGDAAGTQGDLHLDVAAPYFGTQLGLVATDYQALAGASDAGNTAPIVLNAYMPSLSLSGLSKINKYGTTQVRLYFATDLYNGTADYYAFYSGNTGTTALRPLMWVYYNP